MLTFICYPKCTTCQKAKALLDSYHAQYETRDIKTDNPSYDELKTWLALSGLPVRKFFNTSGQLYRSLALKDKLPTMSEDECLRLLATDGMLVKRPLLVDEYRALPPHATSRAGIPLVGFDVREWESVFEYDRKKTDKIFIDYFNEMLEVIKAREEADENPRKTKVVNTPSGKVAITNYDFLVFEEVKLAFNFAVTTEQAYGCRNTAVRKEMFSEEFFELSSGLINELAERLAKENFRLAIVGDFSSCAGNPFHDFIRESNKGRHLFFVTNEEEALKKLGDC